MLSVPGPLPDARVHRGLFLSPAATCREICRFGRLVLACVHSGQRSGLGSKLIGKMLKRSSCLAFRSFVLKGQCHDIQWFFALFCTRKNGDCSRKCRGHWTITARSGAPTPSPPKLSRKNVFFLEQLSFSAALPCARHYFPHTKWLSKIADYRDTAALFF